MSIHIPWDVLDSRLRGKDGLGQNFTLGKDFAIVLTSATIQFPFNEVGDIIKGVTLKGKRSLPILIALLYLIMDATGMRYWKCNRLLKEF